MIGTEEGQQRNRGRPKTQQPILRKLYHHKVDKYWPHCMSCWQMTQSLRGSIIRLHSIKNHWKPWFQTWEAYKHQPHYPGGLSLPRQLGRRLDQINEETLRKRLPQLRRRWTWDKLASHCRGDNSSVRSQVEEVPWYRKIPHYSRDGPNVRL